MHRSGISKPYSFTTNIKLTLSIASQRGSIRALKVPARVLGIEIVGRYSLLLHRPDYPALSNVCQNRKSTTVPMVL